jgi:hypothetical protein
MGKSRAVSKLNIDQEAQQNDRRAMISFRMTITLPLCRFRSGMIECFGINL